MGYRHTAEVGRHVRVRAVGFAGKRTYPKAPAGARPLWHQASVLQGAARPVDFRVRNQVNSAFAQHRATNKPRGTAPVSCISLGAGPGYAL